MKQISVLFSTLFFVILLLSITASAQNLRIPADVQPYKVSTVPPAVFHQVEIVFSATLDTTQAGGAGRTGIGTASFVLSEDQTQLQYQVTVNGLSGSITNAHFHNGLPGVAGGVVKNISFRGNTAYGFWRASDATQSLTPAMLASLLNGELYLNVHTSTFPGGEIRGQIYPANGVGFAAIFDSTQAKTSSAANGTAAVYLSADRSEISYSVTVDGLEGNLAAAHFHNAAPDSAGGVVKDITFIKGTAIGKWKKSDASQPLTDQLIGELLRGRLYLNVHTSKYPGGEIRGQVRLVGGAGFAASLDSIQSGNKNTAGSGTGIFMLTGSKRDQVQYRITVTGLTGTITGAHIHFGAKGISGGVIKPLDFFGTTASGLWASTDSANSFVDSLRLAMARGRLYVNVHTAANPGGEIRGQIELRTGFGFAVGLDGKQAGNNSPGRGTGFVVLDPAQGEIKYNVTVNDLTGNLTSGHFHNAQAGISGGVIKGITFVNGNSGGSWKITDATQPLTGAFVDSLFNRGLYINVHTSTFGGGEVRGQIYPGEGNLTSVQRISDVTPLTFALEQNFPNPFNPSTSIQFALPNDAKVSLKIYDILGREVATLINGDVASAGVNKIEWNGKNAVGQQVASSVYIYRIEAGSYVATKKMMLLK